MNESLHPSASDHLPWFITAPGEPDILMLVMSAILVVAVLTFGILFLRLHTLPERIAHKSQKFQFEIVAVLGLIALFTHMHIFWVAGLLLALIDFPDLGGWLGRIAGSVEKIAAGTSSDRKTGEPEQSTPDIQQVEAATKMLQENIASIRGGENNTAAKPGSAPRRARS